MRPLRIAAVLAVLVVAVVLLLGPGSSDRPIGHADRVLVVSIPALTWDRVADDMPPNLTAFLEHAAVASASVRTIGADTNLAEGYASIGAGNRVAVPGDLGGLAFPPDAEYDGDPVTDVYRRRLGVDPAGAAVLQIGAAGIQNRNDDLLYGAEVGSLGQALRDAGLRAAIVANADNELDPPAAQLHREAALAVMDQFGRIPAGRVDPGLLTEDADALGGVALDPKQVLGTVDQVWDDSVVVLVELSELLRAEAFDFLVTDDVKQAVNDTAMTATDDLFGQLLQRVDLDHDLVLVVAPTSPKGRDQLVVAAVAGPGVVPGRIQSGTTRRAGYVTLPDVGPTVLDALGVDKPGAMNGAPMAVVPGDAPDHAAFRELANENRLALFRNDFTGPLTALFITIQVLTYAMAAYTLSTERLRGSRVAAWLLLAGMAVPFSSFFVGIFPYWRLSIFGAVTLTMAIAAVLGTAIRFVLPRVGWTEHDVLGRALLAPVIITGLTAVLLVGDIGLGGPLQIDTAFGYGGGAIVAGRFSGYGNLAWALMVTAVIIAATGIWSLYERRTGRSLRDGERRFGLGLVAAVFALAVLAVGLPTLGSNVGGTLSVVAGLAITLMALAGMRIGGRRIVATGVGTVAVLAVFGLVDLTRAPEDQTHLGRLIEQTLGDEGISGLGTVIQRKINANLNILLSSVWALIIPAALAFLAFLVWRPPRFLRGLFAAAPSVRACVIGVLATGAIGGIVNDSGIAIPAIMLTLLVPYVAYVIVEARIGTSRSAVDAPPTGDGAGDTTPVAARP